MAAWFAPSIATRLEKAKLRTLADLVTRINGVGARWWTSIAGVGELKAARILDWLRMYEASIGMRIGSHVAVPRNAAAAGAAREGRGPRPRRSCRSRSSSCRPRSTAATGRFRAPLHQCLLEAKNDYEAIAAWLATKHDPNGTGKTATHRAYRKEAERLLLWAILEHGKPLSSLTVEDVNAFKWFLGGAAGALVRTAASPALVAALATARGAAQLDGAAAVDRDPAEPVRFLGEPELPARQRVRRRRAAAGTSSGRSAPGER